MTRREAIQILANQCDNWSHEELTDYIAMKYDMTTIDWSREELIQCVFNDIYDNVSQMDNHQLFQEAQKVELASKQPRKVDDTGTYFQGGKL